MTTEQKLRNEGVRHAIIWGKSFLGRRNKVRRPEARACVMCCRNNEEASRCGWIPAQGARIGGDKASEVKWEAIAIFQVRDAGFSLDVSCEVSPRGPLLPAPRPQRISLSSYSVWYTTCSLACVLCLFS